MIGDNSIGAIFVKFAENSNGVSACVNRNDSSRIGKKAAKGFHTYDVKAESPTNLDISTYLAIESALGFPASSVPRSRMY